MKWKSGSGFIIVDFAPMRDKISGLSNKREKHALVAQLDRVQPSEGWGQAFESPRARHL